MLLQVTDAVKKFEDSVVSVINMKTDLVRIVEYLVQNPDSFKESNLQT